MKKVNILVWFVVIVAIIVVGVILISLFNYLGSESNKITGHSSFKKDVAEDAYLSVYFCSNENVSCRDKFLDVINDASDFVYCALYDLDILQIKEALEKKKITVKIVVESSNSVDMNIPIKMDTNPYLMHNKFCVTEKQVITGSFNPTESTQFINDNNVILSNSTYLIENYVEEFYELFDTKKRNTPYPKITLSNITVENYFCPDDSCEEHVLEILNSSKESIKFMTFSFTSYPIADILIEKKKEGINVSGVVEKMQESKYSQKERMEVNGNIDVHLDGNKKLMHHKVFIVDDKIVITGSYNPTESGTKRNDENILIIYDENIAKLFTQEFNRVWAESSP